MHVSKIRVKRIRVNQGLGVQLDYFLNILRHIWMTSQNVMLLLSNLVMLASM